MGCVTRHLPDQRVADLARAQVHVGHILLGDRAHGVVEARLLAEEGEAVSLVGAEALEPGMDLGSVDLDILADLAICVRAHVSNGRCRRREQRVRWAEDHWRVVTLVDEAIKGNVTEPARGLRGVVVQPLVVRESVAVGRPVRLHDAAESDQDVMEAAQVDARGGRHKAVEPFGEPLAFAVRLGAAEPIRIEMTSLHREVVGRAARSYTSGAKDVGETPRGGVVADHCLAGYDCDPAAP